MHVWIFGRRLDKRLQLAMLAWKMPAIKPASGLSAPACQRSPAGWAGWIFLALLLAGCRTTATRPLADPAPAVARLRAGGSIRSEADHLVQPLLARGEIVGLVVGVVTPDGATQCFGYGRTGRAGDPNAPDAQTLFQIGSLSKLFEEALLIQLEADGIIHEDDTVRGLLPTNLVVSAAAGRLTVHQLATHTGGLPREPVTLSQCGALLHYFATGHNLYSYLTVPYALKYLRHAHPRPKTPPEFIYSNLGAGLLGFLITEKTGTPVTGLMEERICRPLHMTNSVFFLNAEQQRRLAMGHVGNQEYWKPGNTPMPAWDLGDLLRPVGGMYSDMDDLLIFARANLGMLHHPVESALAATHRCQFPTQSGGEARGWIVFNHEDKDGRRVLTFKDGMVSGFHAYIGLDLEARVAVVVLSNTFSWDEKVGHNLLLRLSEACAQGGFPVQSR